jgi:hypothetical protein
MACAIHICMEVSGQIPAPTALLPKERASGGYWMGHWLGRNIGFNTMKKRKSFAPAGNGTRFQPTRMFTYISNIWYTLSTSCRAHKFN